LQESLERVMETLPDVTRSTMLITFAYAVSVCAQDEVCKWKLGTTAIFFCTMERQVA